MTSWRYFMEKIINKGYARESKNGQRDGRV